MTGNWFIHAAYLAVAVVFILGLTVFGEQLQPVQLACFLLIWAALSIFLYDMWAKARAAKAAA